MLGESVREARLKKGLTQARLAKMAGVSRRHLAALEKGANISIGILQRVAAVLELKEIPIGEISLRRNESEHALNVPLLTDTIRQARAEAERAQAILAQAEGILGSDSHGGLQSAFSPLRVRRIDVPTAAMGDILHERPDSLEIKTAGEIRQAQPIDESKIETVTLPKSLVEEDEIVFRARGDAMRDHNIEDGDLLVVERRPRGRAATGELVIGKIGQVVFVGRWWQKRGQKALMTNGLSEVTVGRSTRSLKVVAAINQILRGR
jgi:transcriptional regulator with XRE-family HTH domain